MASHALNTIMKIAATVIAPRPANIVVWMAPKNPLNIFPSTILIDTIRENKEYPKGPT